MEKKIKAPRKASPRSSGAKATPPPPKNPALSHDIDSEVSKFQKEREQEGAHSPVGTALKAVEPKTQVELGALANGEPIPPIKPNTLLIFPVKSSVLFPQNVMPLTAGKDWSLENIEKAIRNGQGIGAVASRTVVPEAPSDSSTPAKPMEKHFELGTEAKILKVIRFPDNSYGAVVQGNRKFKILSILEEYGHSFLAQVEYLPELKLQDSLENQALTRGLKQLVQKAVSLSPNIPSDASLFIEGVNDPVYLSNLVIPYLSVDFTVRQGLLELTDASALLRKVHVLLTREIEILEMSQKIHSEVKTEVGKQQRKYYLKEQLRQLQKELGEMEGKSSLPEDNQDTREKIEASAMPAEAKALALKEVDRMGMMSPGSPEFTVSHTYLQWLMDVPWGVHSPWDLDLKQAQGILDSDHFGLEKVKKRIMEFLAIHRLSPKAKPPIFVLVGPPGVGKTSLGKSIAKAMGRPFVRIALGGLRDEAEIRGHRRTYIGSMPGKFVDALKKAGTMNPLILLDEIDKVSADFRGDPSSALLEVLDSEQNHTFTDHYLNTPLDLSQVIFIATANSLSTISPPLLDRLEVIELSGYTTLEKTHIAEKYLIPQTLADLGLSQRMEISKPNAWITPLIEQYTRESGVRDLRRQMASVMRQVAKAGLETGKLASDKTNSEPTKPWKVTMEAKDLKTYLGVPPYLSTTKLDFMPIGVSNGLAYTPVGGDVLFIESVAWKGGSGKLQITGQLGDVMKESVHTAYAYLRSQAPARKIHPDFFTKIDLHIHFPAGAVKKDGPSAGVAIFLALASQAFQQPLPANLAVTGEISLRAQVLPVGGIKEKIIAAHRAGMKTILLPKENEKNLEDIPKEVLKDLTIHCVGHLDEVLQIAFAKPTKSGFKKKKS